MRAVLFTAFSIIAIWMLAAWDMMISVGAAHDSWWHIIPPMSWSQACGITSPVLVALSIGALWQAVFGD